MGERRDTCNYGCTADSQELIQDLEHLDRVRHAPMIVQEKICKGTDVRVNIFGDAVYAGTRQRLAPKCSAANRYSPPCKV